MNMVLRNDTSLEDAATLIRGSLEELLVAAKSLVIRPAAFPAAVATLAAARALLMLYRACLSAMSNEKQRPEKSDRDTLESHLNELNAALKKPSVESSKETSSSMLRLLVSGECSLMGPA